MATHLYLAAHRHCGGWAKALKMAGIDPATALAGAIRRNRERGEDW